MHGAAIAIDFPWSATSICITVTTHSHLLTQQPAHSHTARVHYGSSLPSLLMQRPAPDVASVAILKLPRLYADAFRVPRVVARDAASLRADARAGRQHLHHALRDAAILD